MPGVEIQPSAATQATTRHHCVSVIQGGLSAFGDGFAFAIIVMVAYVSILAERFLVVGLVPLIAVGLWNLGSLTVSIVLRGRLRAKWVAASFSIARTVSMAAIAWIAYQESTSADDRLRQILAAYAAFSFFSGMTSTSVNSAVRSSANISSRSKLFIQRGVTGGLLVAVAGAVVYQVFSDSSLEVNRAFSYCFIAATAAIASSSFFILTMRGTRSLPDSADSALRKQSAWKHRSFQRFIVFRVVMAAAGLADILFVVYAIQEIGLDLSFLGILVAASGLTFAAATLLWREVAKRAGGRGTLQLSAGLKLAAPLLALTSIYLARSEFYTERRDDTLILEILVVSAFVALSLATTCINSGSFRYLADSRLSVTTDATGWTNLVIGISSAFALLGVWIVDKWDFETAFGVAIACSLAATLTSGLLANPVSRSRPRSTSTPRLGIGYSRTYLSSR